MIQTPNITQPCDEYALTIENVKLVRDCIEGEPAVKRGRMLYLKHPNSIDQTSAGQIARYSSYLDCAEFDEYPATTLVSMLGQMTDGKIAVELPDRLAQLEQDIDGDGMPLAGAVEILYSNILQVKFHILLAEYKGLANVPIESVTVADVKAQKPRAMVKMYTRESLIDWDFRRINGKQQLSLMVLLEQAVERAADLSRHTVSSYLVVALDDNGDYYQQKFVVNKDGGVNSDGDKVYITDARGVRLKWIPAEIIIDEEWPAGSLPRRPGFLYPTCVMALHRYKVSADYKEALRFFGPTGFSQGWKEGDIELFERINDRSYIAYGIGVTNLLPEGVTHDIKGMDIQTESFERYFESNDKRARAVGAIINDPANARDRTATEARIENKNATAVMSMIVKNVESALRRVILYCGMFEGLWGQDQIESNLDKVNITLPREFIVVAMSQEEVNTIVATYTAGLISKDEAMRKLVAGGFTIGTAEQIMAEMEAAGPSPIA